MTDLNRYIRPRASNTFLLWLITSILIGGASLLCWLGFQQHQLLERVTTRNDKLIAIKASSKAPIVGRGEQEMLKRWALLQKERNFPWTSIFLAVERTSSTDIELLEFKPDKLNRNIALSGEARNMKALVIYLAELSKQPALKNVYLMHQQTVQRDSLETVSFEVRATLVE